MVRIYSIIAAFVAVTLGLVLLQPSLEEEVASAPRPIEAVSRDAVNLLDTVEPAPLDALVAQALTEAIGAPELSDTGAPATAPPSDHHNPRHTCTRWRPGSDDMGHARQPSARHRPKPPARRKG